MGHRCSGARVNGQLVSLKYILRSGDTVEIITTPAAVTDARLAQVGQRRRGQRPKIRNWLKMQQRERSVLLGREIFDGDLHRYQLDYATLQNEGKVAWLTKELGMKDEETLLSAIGYGRITTRHALAKLMSPEKLGCRTEKG